MNEPSGVWPPPIKAEVAPIQTGIKPAQEWASLWMGGAGLSIWPCAAATIIWLLPHGVDNDGIVATLDMILVGGPILALAGAITGWLNRRTNLGRVGLVLSLVVLIAMGTLLVAIRVVTDDWLWFFYDSW